MPITKRALLIVITDYPGGAERVTFGLAAELASRPGWQVEVLIVCSQLSDSFSRRVLPPTVHVSYGPARNWYLSFPILPFRLLRRRFDFVFTTHVYTNALLSVMRRWKLIKAGAMIARESTAVFDRSTGMRKRLFKRMYRAYGREDLLIAQTDYIADHLRPWLSGPTLAHLHVKPNPVDLVAIDAAVGEGLGNEDKARLAGRTNILFCGRLIPVKQPRLAMDAFHEIAISDAAAQLVFVGFGPLESELRQEAIRRGLEQQILFLGKRTNPYPLFAVCHYGLLTSLREGFPNVVLEMMACGLKKIVVTPCAGDLDKLPGVTITAGFDVADIADALREAIESGADCSPAYRAEAARRGVGAYLDDMLKIGRLHNGHDH